MPKDGAQVRGQAEAAGVCSAGFRGKKGVVDRLLQGKELHPFSLKEGFEATKVDENPRVRLLKGKVWVYYWLLYPKGGLQLLPE